MADAVSVSFTDFAKVWGCELTVSRGVTPSIATLYMLPQAELAAAPGDLKFIVGEDEFVWPDMLPVLSSLRMASDGRNRRWSIQLLDRRRTWQGGYIEGEWNPRNVDGTIPAARKLNAKELVEYILDEIGEEDYDTDNVPTSVYPYLKGPMRWDHALARVCSLVACEVCPQADGTFAICPLGTGGDLPETGNLHPIFTFKPATRPSSVIVRGGPSLFQSKLALAARYFNGDYPAYVAVGTDWPAAFPSVASGSRHLAFSYGYRLFQVAGQASGGLSVPGCDETISSVSQYLPIRDHLLTLGTDPNGNTLLERAVVEGTFWPRGDYPANTAANTMHPGNFVIWPNHGMVYFDEPVVAIGAGNTFALPTLYLTTSYSVQKADGSGPVAREVSKEVEDGSGPPLIIHRPELVHAVVASYNGTTLSGTSSNATAIDAELEAYAEMFAAAAEADEHKEGTFAGIIPTSLDGKIAQVKYFAAVDAPPYTRISSGFECDNYSLSAAERRRNEAVDRMMEKLE